MFDELWLSTNALSDIGKEQITRKQPVPITKKTRASLRSCINFISDKTLRVEFIPRHRTTVPFCELRIASGDRRTQKQKQKPDTADIFIQT